jgi:VWFA-related protein
MLFRSVLATVALAGAFALGVSAQKRPKLQTVPAAGNGTEMSVLVTAVPRGDRERAIADALKPGDFAVYENKNRQKITSVKRAADSPMFIAVVIQDSLNWRVNSEIKELRSFIEKLPDGTRVMTAYLTIGGAIVTQELTTNRKQAAETLRIVRGGSFPPSFSPYQGVTDVAKHFDKSANGRRMMIIISDGLDMSRGFAGASPFFSVDLDRAIRECQQRAIAVYTIYAPGGEDRRRFSRFEFNYGQGSLIRLADETGGESYFTTFGFNNFSPYLEEFTETYALQWLIDYKSSTVGKGFRKIEITTDFDVPLHHSAGYFPRTQ